jgi:Fic family protein
MFLCFSIEMADWSSEKTLDFIEEYRKYTELWRSSDKNYKNREERRSALQELGEKYSLDSKSNLNKIKSLRSFFDREDSKVLKKKSGSSADEMYRSSRFVYKHMLFILQGDEAREGKYTITTLEESLVSICISIFF